MDIDYSSIVSKSDKEVNLSKDNIDEFVDQCFKNLVNEYEEEGIEIKDHYQGMASHVGELFERIFKYIIESEYDVVVERGVSLPDANMTGTGRADSVFYVDGQIAGIIELKGNPEAYKNKDGEILHKPSSSGLKRSDTVKKAVCQAYQADYGYPDVPFFIVSNSFPDEDSSPSVVLSMAEGDIIDLVVNIKDPEDISNMIKICRSSVTSPTH